MKMVICTYRKAPYMKERTEKSIQLYHILQQRGYPESLCVLISRNLNTDFTAKRMIGYLSYYKTLPETEIVDEMLAILSDRKVLSASPGRNPLLCS